MAKKLLLTVVVCSISVPGLIGKDTEETKLNIVFVDSFKAMRECKDGLVVGKEIDTARENASKQLRSDAEKLAKMEAELKNKMSTLKPQELAKQSRDLDKRKRDLEEMLREKEEEIKITMQQKTEELAIKVEEGIVAVAKEKGVDAVIDKMTGRVMYTKDNNKGDITVDAIKFVDQKSEKLAQASLSEKDQKTVIAQTDTKAKDAAKAA